MGGSVVHHDNQICLDDDSHFYVTLVSSDKKKM